MAGNIVFDILAKDRASDKFDKVGKSADQSHGKVSKFGNGLKTAAKVGVLAIGAAAIGGGIALAKMAKSAAEDEVAAKRLAKQLQNSAHATKGQVAQTEDWISKQGVLYGVTDDELRPALGKLVSATHDVGKAQKLATLAMDISAGSGQSLEMVSKSLMKAQNGQVGSLSRLGIKTQDSVKDQAALQHAQIAASDAQSKYNQALKQFGPHAKETQVAAAKLEYAQTRLGEANGKVKKVTITADEAFQRLAKTYGGQASTKANTFQGKMDRLKLVMDETKESIGYKLLPILTNLATWFLAKGVPAMSKFGAKLVSVGKFIQRNHDVIVPIVAVLGSLAGTAFVVVKVLKIWTAAQAALNVVMSANPISLVVIAIAALVAGAIIAYKKVKWFHDGVNAAFKGIVAGAKFMWSMLKPIFALWKLEFQAVAKVGIWLWNHALQPVFKLIVQGMGFMMQKWGGMLRTLGKVPGFGWAKKAGDAMVAAGRSAANMADHIKKIPNSHTTNINTPGMAAALANARALGNIYAGIPKTLRTQIIATKVNKVERQMHRASGGPVRAGVGYRINENGVESFVPAVNGRMLSASETQKMTSRSGTQKMVAPEIHLEAHIHLEGETIVKSIRTRNRNRGVASAGI